MNPWVLVPVETPSLNCFWYHRSSFYFRCHMSLGLVCGLHVLVLYIALRPYGRFGPVVCPMTEKHLLFLLLLLPVPLHRRSNFGWAITVCPSDAQHFPESIRLAICCDVQYQTPGRMLPFTPSHVSSRCRLFCLHDLTLHLMQCLY